MGTRRRRQGCAQVTPGRDEAPQGQSQYLAAPVCSEVTAQGGAAAEAAPSPGSPDGQGDPGEAAGEDPSESATDELTVTKMELEERTLDLQRLQAEFLNYKRRVDRDRELIKENATFSALAPITRSEEHTSELQSLMRTQSAG